MRVGLPLARRLVSGEYTPLFAYFAIVAIFSQVDIFMLKLVASSTDLASYGAAFRYYALLSLALGAVHAVLLPAIQRAASLEQLSALFAQHMRLLLAFGPAVLVTAWLAQWVLPWIDRGRYPDAVPAFQVLAVSSIISFAFSPHVNLLLKYERFWFLLVVIALALASAVVLHALLIPRYGAVGAALVTLIAAGGANAAFFAKARRLGRAANVA
jgi:O-antigen/teichoic acid export membrane protein